MGTLKYLDDNTIAKTSEEAIEKLISGEYRSIVVFSSDRKKLSNIISEIYKGISEHNKMIPDVKEQILPTDPYYWDDIDGCLGVKCAEIAAGLYKNMAGGLFIFAQPRYSCLTNPSAREPLSSKAVATLAMLGSIVSGRD